MDPRNAPPKSPRTLNIGASSENYRQVPVITAQTAEADTYTAEEKMENFTSEELKNLGMTYNESSHYDRAIVHLSLALMKLDSEELSEENKIRIRTECLHGLANCQRELGQDQDAIQGYTKALAECEKIKDRAQYLEISYRILRDLGIACFKVEQYKEAQPHFFKAIAVADEAKKEGRIPAVTSYHGLALVLAKESVELVEKGFLELNKARNLYPHETREKSMDWAAHRYHMGRAYESSGQYALAFVEYDESRRLRDQIIDRKKIGDVYYHNRMSDTYMGLGRTAVNLRQYADAKKYFAKAQESYQALKAEGKLKHVESILLGLDKLYPELQQPSTPRLKVANGLFKPGQEKVVVKPALESTLLIGSKR
jgi:tetratricopeptide (TPR) repeat protein